MAWPVKLTLRSKWWILAGLAFCMALALVVFPGGLELRITPVGQDEPMLVLPMWPGETFTIQYYHSVENAPIWETHSLDADGRIFIEQEKYLKFGAGMGKMPGVGKMVKEGPYEVIKDMHMPTGNFILRIGSPGVDHTIIWRGRRINLSSLAPHVAVRFAARKVSLVEMLWRTMMPCLPTPVSLDRS